MPKRTFTPTWIKTLKPADDRQDFTEAGRPGFMLRCWPGGQKTFVFRYFRNDRSQIMTLGQWPAMSLEEAHDEHAAARKLLARDLDPIAERERDARAREIREHHEKTSRAITIRNVIAEWAWHYARKHRKRPREAVRLLKTSTKPWMGRPARQLVKRDVVTLLDKIVARGSLVMANRMASLLSQVFAYAVARDLLPSSPAAGLLRPGGEEESSERSLDRHEVKVFWDAMRAPETAISKQVRLGLKLILVTAQRPGEVVNAKLDAFDLADRVWTIPADIAKNEREHFVPLTDLAIELVEQLRQLGKDRPHLLPSVHSKLKPDEPISQRALSRAFKNNHTELDDDPKLFGLEPFTPHDLRRTASTHMTSLGIPRLHVEKLLNHSDNETTGIYDRHHYWDEKKRALEIWESELRAIIAGEKPSVKQSKTAAIRGARSHGR